MMNQKIDIAGKIRELESEMDRSAHQFQTKQVETERIKLDIQTREKALETEIQRLKAEAERDLAKKRSDLSKTERDLDILNREHDKHNQELERFHHALNEVLEEERMAVHKK